MPKRIMVIDDNREILTLLTFMLSRRGYIVDTAPDALTALAKLESAIPDLFILDIMMPGMNGLELCRQLRVRDETAQVPIIICSADANKQTKEMGFAAGAVDYIVKPVRNTEILMRVARALEPNGKVGGVESGAAGQH